MPAEQLNATTLHYDVAGHGEPLVLVHGAWVDGRTWAGVVPGLARSFQVVTYDLRGHGRSPLEPPDAGTVHDDVADLAALIRRLGIAPAHLAGVSSGACIALRLAARYPELTGKVVAHEPPFTRVLDGDADAEPLVEAFHEKLAEVRRLLEAGDHRAGAQRFWEIEDRAWSQLPEDDRETWLRHAPAFLGQLRDPDAVTLEVHGLRPIARSVLLSGGSESPPFYAFLLDALAAQLPGIHRHCFVGAGHLPHRTHPDRYVEALAGFLRS